MCTSPFRFFTLLPTNSDPLPYTAMADSSNTGRNFLLIGALLGIGAAAAGVYINSSSPVYPIDTSVSSSKKPAALTEEARRLTENALTVRTLADVAPQGAVVPRLAAKDGAEPRYTPLFFAPKLWLIASGVKGDVRDLLDPKSQSLHQDVPNTEFFKYGLDASLGDADALDQDHDGDGFTTGEEFAAGTNPADKASMPPFAGENGVKMVATERKADSYSLALDSMFPYTGEVNISIFEGKGASRNPMRLDQAKTLQEGSTFGLGKDAAPGPMNKDRFKVVSTKGEENGSKFIEIEDTYAKVPSQRVFKLRPGSKDDQMHAIDDVVVNFRMTAGPDKDKTLKTPVQLGETFEVPGFPGVTCTVVKATSRDVRVMIGESEFRIPFEKKSANKETK